MKKLLLAAAIAASPALAAVPAPDPAIATLAELPVVIDKPYDESLDADAAVAAAFAKAKKSHKLVLIDLGGNWCPDCIVLANFLHLPGVSRFVNQHYEVVSVDVGRFNKNLQVPARFGFHERLKGVPTVLVATPDGNLVNDGNVFAFTDARHMTPGALADYLARWPS
jgi:thiol-disulfide isomerase/thioredoxin